MNTYKIEITHGVVNDWSPTEGQIDGNTLHKDMELSITIRRDNPITRKDILVAVTGMLYHDGEVTTDNLFDGNGDFFIFTRLENAEGVELREHEEGYIVDYYIYVKQVVNLSVTDIK